MGLRFAPNWGEKILEYEVTNPTKHFNHECTINLIHTIQDHILDRGKSHTIPQKQNALFSLEDYLAGPFAKCGGRFSQ